MDGVSLAIGVGSLAIQLFDGAVKGFHIFEEAALADKKLEHCKLQLRIEYEKLEQWGIMSGLSSDDPKKYAPHIRRNDALTIATLSQLKEFLKSLRAKELKYESIETKTEGVAKLALSALKLGDISGTAGATAKAQPAKGELDIIMRLPDAPADRQAFRERCWKRIKARSSDIAKVTKEPRRFKWAIVDEEKFEASIIHVRSLVTSLATMLSRDQMSLLVENTNSFKLILLQLTTDVRDMKTLLRADGGDGFSDVGSMSLSGSTLVGNLSSAARGSLSGTTLAASEADADDARGVTSLWRAATLFSIAASTLDSTKVEPGEAVEYTQRPSDGGLAITGEGSSQMWIEWKDFTPVVGVSKEGGTIEVIPDGTVESVKKLVALLQLEKKPVEFCVPTLVGYFQEQKRYGLIFKSPANVSMANKIPTPLATRYHSERVALGTRINLALRLSQWLLYLHAVNWLHKGLRSDMVLFFTDKLSKTSQLQVGGFEYARAAADITASTGPSEDPWRAMYIHPDYLSQRQDYKKTYDMYSLGIILVELAYWKPIGEVMGIVDPPQTLTEASRHAMPVRYARGSPNEPNAVPSATTGAATIDAASSAAPDLRNPPRVPKMGQVRRIKENLLAANSPYLEYIGETMGDRYLRATKTCLVGMEGEDGLGLLDTQIQVNPSVGALMQQAFIERVVDQLKGVVV